MKDDERRFLADIYKRCRNGYEKREGTTPRSIINEPDFYMHHKRAWRILEKWCGKGWYEYGVTLDLGWLTPEGLAQSAIEIDRIIPVKRGPEHETKVSKEVD